MIITELMAFIGYGVIILLLLASVYTTIKYQMSITTFRVLMVVLIIITMLWTFLSISFHPPIPEPVYTGEVMKMYINGTALLDNGTLIKISEISGLGCY